MTAGLQGRETVGHARLQVAAEQKPPRPLTCRGRALPRKATSRRYNLLSPAPAPRSPGKLARSYSAEHKHAGADYRPKAQECEIPGAQHLRGHAGPHERA